MRGWTSGGHRVELTAWQEHAVRALLDGRRKHVIAIRGRQWGWTTVLATALRYDRNPGLLHGQPGDPVTAGADNLGPPPGSGSGGEYGAEATMAVTPGQRRRRR